MIEKIADSGLNFNRAQARPEGSVWRLVHDHSSVRMLELTCDQTDSIHEIRDFDSKQEALEYIQSASLQYDEPEPTEESKP